jgi:pimeloyl-ACP methyl ester carboxylesterase
MINHAKKINPMDSFKSAIEKNVKNSKKNYSELAESGKKIAELSKVHSQKLQKSISQESEKIKKMLSEIQKNIETNPIQHPQDLFASYSEYLRDAAERQVHFFDTLRARGNIYIEHSTAGMPPVLDFEYEVIMDGLEMTPATNYMLLKITPPKGTKIYADRAPIIIIDPRAGHGAGIGGFKPQSQVGDGFEDGHQVYFVAFRQQPVPHQTLADVRDAEIQFVQEVSRLHSDAPKPILIGNCQGGWAAMLVAAKVPEMLGPIVLNGSPLSYWAGKRGENPMRYTGGVKGGAMPALLASDLGHGIFDGAALVENFEKLNPANSIWSKYYNLYANVDSERERFLEFERWWGGYALMTEEEIRWIVENLFVGNKLTAGESVLGYDRVDLKKLESPVIVFASHGDNITPPQQALHWIADVYASVDEIKARGQRIVYMVHESIGHLGIFVSAKIAGREHEAITDTFRAIEALSPGLYEMVLQDATDRVHVRFEPRDISDVLAVANDPDDDDDLFAEVSKMSEIGVEMYERFMRPVIQNMVTEDSAEILRQLNPLRTQRLIFSDKNPIMPMFDKMFEGFKSERHPATKNNPFLQMEKVFAESIESQLNFYRDMRDAMTELMFFSMYSSPVVKAMTKPIHSDKKRKNIDVREMPEIRLALSLMEVGGVPEAVVRMLHLITKARGYVRRTRLERELQALQRSHFPDLKNEEPLSHLIHTQSLIVDFEPNLAQQSLPILLDTEEKQKEALDLVMEVAGPEDTMHPAALKKYQEFEKMFEKKGVAKKNSVKKSAKTKD